MADKRKLQGEIDRCLKKVQEGVETFEDIWKKVHSASNANQKEKYEADLKKEIKKLQRLRDQIKTWMASNDIKDKRTLQENRKLIETQMERFKVVERETKTKAYSKEGLGLAAKIDPATKEREEASIWITEVLERLQIEVDQIESEIEQVYAGSRKKKLDRDRQDKVDELQEWAGRHRHHNQQWETILRMLDNCTIQPDDIKKLQEDMDYYLDCYKEPDFQENEFMYDDFDLEENIAALNTLATSPTEDDDLIVNHNHVPMSPSSTVPPSSPGTPGTPSIPTTPTTTTGPNSGTGTKINLSSPRKNSKNESLQANSLPNNSPPRTSAFKMNNSSQPAVTQTSSATTPGPTIIKASNTPAKVVNSTIHTNAVENHEASNGEEPVQKSSQPNTPPPPVSGYAVAAGAQQNHVECAPTSPVVSVVPTRPVNHISSASTTVANSLSRTSSVPGNATDLSTHTNHFPESESAASSMADFVSSIASLSITTPPTISTAVPPPQCNSLPPASSTSLSSVLGMKPATSATQVPIQSVSTSLTSSLPPSSVPVSAQASDLGGFNLSMTTPLSSNSGPVIPSSTMSKGGEPLVSSANPPASILSGSHLMSNSGPTQQPSTSNSFSSLKSMAAQAVATAGLNNSISTPTTDYSTESRSLFDTSNSQTTDKTKALQETNTAHLQPLLGVAPLGPVPLNKERCYQLAMVEAAYHHQPQPADSEKVRPYLQRSPYPTPAHHHQHPPQHVDSIEFFQRLSTETLFFIFYYQEGTRAQYLAAKALKKQSWRFHTKYMMWFQRHEEPKAITDEYEQGTYIYFDYEKWGQRKKEGFTFEYRYLEDKELP